MQFYLGISSGVLCVIFGIYEDLLNHVLSFFSDIKKHSKFLLPIFIGAIIGVLIFSNIINYFLIKFPIHTKSIFIGFILGSIPSLIKKINYENNFKLHYLLYTLVAFIIGIGLVLLENYISNGNGSNFTPLYLFICGFTMSIGVIVPGVSSTVILMLFGVYTSYLSAISSLYFPLLIPLGIGLFFGCLFCMKLTKFLLNKFHAQTFYTIVGFSLGSTFVLMPNISFDTTFFISLLCILLGFIIVKLFKL